MKRIKFFLLVFAAACFIGLAGCKGLGKKMEEAVEDTMEEAVEALEEVEEAVEEMADTVAVDTTVVEEVE
jgi:hypothetical protein